jgi:predicted phage baseplate assembly protein
MPLEPPDLDTRTFEEIVALARARIPRYTPEWTDFNESDPGITLVQLFGWLTEMLLYEMNRVPGRSYVKFLQLLGMEVRPAQPARADLTFTAQQGAPRVDPVPAGTQVGGQPADGGDMVIFETSAGLDLVRPALTDVQVFDGSAFTVVTAQNTTAAAPFRPLGWIPAVGSALYLGFTPDDPPSGARPFPQEVSLRVFLPTAAPTAAMASCEGARQLPAPPASLVWECRPTASASRWRALSVYEDSSVAFTQEGYVKLQGPAEVAPTVEGKVTEPRLWLRARLAGGGYPVGAEPEIDALRPNTVPAESLVTVREELVGISEGHPAQRFSLRHRPVQAGTLMLVTQAAGEEAERWEARDDLLASGPDDPHYVLNATSGEIRFGDGARGRIPVAGTEIVARSYRYGGGASANLGAGLATTPLTRLAGVEEVTNERPAVGGRDEQDVEELKQRAPSVLRNRGRAVTPEDFAALALEVGGVERTAALPLAHPDHPGVDVPGAVTVVVVPEDEAVPPVPSRDLVRAVCRRLDRARLLTTEVHVTGPEYREVTVEARVAAHAYAALGAVERDVRAALDRFLDPLRRPFGEDLVPSNIFGVILAVPEVAAVPSLSVLVGGRPQLLTEQVRVPPGGLLYGAGHAILVVRHQDR